MRIFFLTGHFFLTYIFSLLDSRKYITVSSKSSNLKQECIERICSVKMFLNLMLNDNFFFFTIFLVEIVTEGKRKKSSSSDLQEVCVNLPYYFEVAGILQWF